MPLTRWLTLLLLACADTEARVEWQGVVDTLSNGAIRVANPSTGLWRAGAEWRLEQELEIGVSDGPEAFIFSAISGLAVDDEGRIYVLDRQANELRMFSPAGTHLRTVGRSGGGPGEYTNANGLVRVAPDTLVVVDQRGARYTILTGEGDYVRSVSRQLPFYGWAFSGAVVGDRIYEQGWVGNDPELRPAFLGTALRASPGTTGARDTVLLPVPEGPTFQAFSIQTDRGGMSMSVPFTPRPVYYLDSRGTVWHGNGREFRITRTNFPGDTILELVLDARPAPVTSAELAEWEQGDWVERFRELGGELDMGRIPSVKPFFDALYLSDDGHLWVSVPAGANEATFAVFDSAARYLGRLAVDVRRDVFVPPVVRNGRLYFVGRDELDVPKVYGFRIVNQGR
jgi:hypothetical protein